MKLRRSDAKPVVQTTNSASRNNVAASSQNYDYNEVSKLLTIEQPSSFISFLARIQYSFLNSRFISYVLIDIVNCDLRRCRRK
jgi:hypothetical protein